MVHGCNLGSLLTRKKPSLSLAVWTHRQASPAHTGSHWDVQSAAHLTQGSHDALHLRRGGIVVLGRGLGGGPDPQSSEPHLQRDKQCPPSNPNPHPHPQPT